MKKIIYLFVIAIVFAACGSKENPKEEPTVPDGKDTTADAPTAQSFGEEITEENALDIAAFKEALKGKDSLETKLVATVNSVCKKKGCWMVVDLGDGQEMRVKFKDYGFFVPMDIEGKTVIIEGWAKTDTLSVADAKHLLHDENASKEEIDAVKAPVAELTFLAHGVILKD